MNPDNDVSNPNIRFSFAAAVPEPSTCAMALAGLACGGYSMWWRRKRAKCSEANLISTRGEQVAVTGLLPSVFSR